MDAVALEGRAAGLAKRSIKREAKVFALELAVRMMDLTTLEGADTPGQGRRARARRRMRPDPADPKVPVGRRDLRLPEPRADRGRAAARDGREGRLGGDRVPVGPVAARAKLEEVRGVVELGADEVDMVIDRGAFLSGRYAKVYDEIVQIKEACGDAHLKVILEVAELGTYDNVRRASLLAMAAGADFIKTSTGKLPARRRCP